MDLTKDEFGTLHLNYGLAPRPRPLERDCQNAAVDKDLSFHVPPHFRPLRIVSASSQFDLFQSNRLL